MVTPLPRVVVAAPASGSGKTTVATGLMAALRRRGLIVSPHKVGPDYIDPGYHALACGRPGRNLDPWLVGEQRIAPLLLHGALTPTPADIAVVEGVMGLYDGASGRNGFASTAHVAELIDAPVLLVLDVRAQARTAAAVVLGMQAFDPTVRIGGALLNRVGSQGHERLLREALAEIGVPVLGAIPRTELVAAPSRHLGLVPVAERAPESLAVVDALADLVARTVDLDAVLALAGSAPGLSARPWDATAEVAAVPVDRDQLTSDQLTSDQVDRDQVDRDQVDRDQVDRDQVDRDQVRWAVRPRVAVASGPAFTFGYAETAELLTAAGADVVGFDPLHDAALPRGSAGVVIGGGFPEMHAEALSANSSLRAELADFDGPILAECAGLLYLGDSLDGAPMVGRLALRSRMTPRLTLGYREAVAAADSCVAATGEVVRGHEFHRTTTDPGHGVRAAWSWDGERSGFVDEAVHASYLHTHWAGHPASAGRFVRACAGVPA